jgi:hypothetical protein
MSADMHHGIARRTAYLRLAASRGDTCFAVQTKWGYAVTQTSWPWRKQATC